MQTVGRFAAAHFAVDDEDAIRRTLFVARGEGDEGAEDDDDGGGGEEENVEVGRGWELHG